MVQILIRSQDSVSTKEVVRSLSYKQNDIVSNWRPKIVKMVLFQDNRWNEIFSEANKNKCGNRIMFCKRSRCMVMRLATSLLSCLGHGVIKHRHRCLAE